MFDGKEGYRFGDLTRGAIRWLGPSVHFVRGKFDWLKVGKALVLAFLAGQTINFAVVAGALTDAVKDPDWAATIPTLATIIVYLVEQGRRHLQDGRDAKQAPPSEKPADGHHQEG